MNHTPTRATNVLKNVIAMATFYAIGEFWGTQTFHTLLKPF
jgi:hypothetical protein